MWSRCFVAAAAIDIRLIPRPTIRFSFCLPACPLSDFRLPYYLSIVESLPTRLPARTWVPTFCSLTNQCSRRRAQSHQWLTTSTSALGEEPSLTSGSPPQPVP
ncbi:unnamed protein product [Boreogadus saida]